MSVLTMKELERIAVDVAEKDVVCRDCGHGGHQHIWRDHPSKGRVLGACLRFGCGCRGFLCVARATFVLSGEIERIQMVRVRSHDGWTEEAELEERSGGTK